MPYLRALEVCSRQGDIQIHVYRTLPLPHYEEKHTRKPQSKYRQTRPHVRTVYFIYYAHSSQHNKNTHVDIHNTVKILKLHKIQGYKKPTLR